MKKCHKADHATIVELRDAYEEAVAERDRARDLAAHLDDEIARIQRDTIARIQRGGTS